MNLPYKLKAKSPNGQPKIYKFSCEALMITCHKMLINNKFVDPKSMRYTVAGYSGSFSDPTKNFYKKLTPKVV
jgi:hypothetical protein